MNIKVNYLCMLKNKFIPNKRTVNYFEKKKILSPHLVHVVIEWPLTTFQKWIQIKTLVVSKSKQEGKYVMVNLSMKFINYDRMTTAKST